ncbi:MAG: hypothetical protein CVU86_07145 [Firmicutes bacterium HGW-Firmicutes-11]|jgi:carboxyl-terminal processing protease|nr:MAG: hypothetical protein CVU86_07145 [Firmicutes bacterium HGW-Firmicutes-11]
MSPNTARAVAKVIAIILVAALVITSFSFVFLLGTGKGAVYGATTTETQFLDRQLNYLKELMIDVSENYKDEVTFQTLIDGAFRGTIESLKDPYSIYYASSEEAEQFVESVSGEFSGIGVSIESYNGQVRVVAPLAGTPAEKAGILAGDVIVKVDGNSVAGLTVDQVVAKLKGETGTKVSVTVDRGGTQITFSLVREVIKTVSVTWQLKEGNVGYIRIAQFDKDTHLEFKNAKLQLIAQGADRFLVDVRNNPGGYTAVAADIASQMMPKGPITHFAQKGSIVETVTADGTGDLDLPVVLLVNEGTASAAEILAGAWQDSETALIVGVTTYGKGVAQQVLELPNGGSMKLSSFYFLTPLEHTIDKTGISPDFTIQNLQTVASAEIKASYLGFAPMAETTKPKAGDTGLNVYGAQQRLKFLGYKTAATGTMDATTVTAVKAFQKEAGLYSYGVLDYSTMNAIDRAAATLATGSAESGDLQMDKGLELLKQ